MNLIKVFLSHFYGSKMELIWHWQYLYCMEKVIKIVFNLPYLIHRYITWVLLWLTHLISLLTNRFIPNQQPAHSNKTVPHSWQLLCGSLWPALERNKLKKKPACKAHLSTISLYELLNYLILETHRQNTFTNSPLKFSLSAKAQLSQIWMLNQFQITANN